MANEAVSTFKKFPIIGRYSYEQTRFLRQDPEPHKMFEHEVQAQQRKEAIKEVGLSLLAFGSLIAMLAVGWMA